MANEHADRKSNGSAKVALPVWLASAARHSATATGWVLHGDQRGAVFTEYVVVMATAGLGIALSIAALSRPLLTLYTYTERLIGLPVP
jgi:hypothetical protein